MVILEMNSGMRYYHIHNGNNFSYDPAVSSNYESVGRMRTGHKRQRMDGVVHVDPSHGVGVVEIGERAVSSLV